MDLRDVLQLDRSPQRDGPSAKFFFDANVSCHRLSVVTSVEYRIHDFVKFQHDLKEFDRLGRGDAELISDSDTLELRVSSASHGKVIVKLRLHQDFGAGYEVTVCCRTELSALGNWVRSVGDLLLVLEQFDE